MNWYKQSQVIVDDNAKEGYGLIGHWEDKSIMWAWHEDQILTGPASDTHMKWLMDTYGKFPSSFYRGRYDEKKGHKRVSIIPSRSGGFRSVPDEIIKGLARKFGDDIEIEVFRP